MSEKIDKYIAEKVRSVIGYTNTHHHAKGQGIPVNMDEIPKTIDEMLDLCARLVFIDQQKEVTELKSELSKKDEEIERLKLQIDF